MGFSGASPGRREFGCRFLESRQQFCVVFGFYRLVTVPIGADKARGTEAAIRAKAPDFIVLQGVK